MELRCAGVGAVKGFVFEDAARRCLASCLRKILCQSKCINASIVILPNGRNSERWSLLVIGAALETCCRNCLLWGFEFVVVISGSFDCIFARWFSGVLPGNLATGMD